MNKNICFRDLLNNNDLIWDNASELPMNWHEGAFCGNGRMGALVYFKTDDMGSLKVNVELGRSDVYDTRETRDFWMAKQFDNPRLPIGALTYTLSKGNNQVPDCLKRADLSKCIIKDFKMRLKLYDAKIDIYIKTDKEVVHSEIYTAGKKDIIAVKQIEGDAKGWSFEPARAVSPRQAYGLLNEERDRVDKNYMENKAPYIAAKGNMSFCIQELNGGYNTITGIKREENYLLIHINQEKGLCVDKTEKYLSSVDICTMEKEHKNWWHDYYSISWLKIPDKRLEQFYWLQIYKLASATRENGHIMDNQGPWLQTTPWPGTWWNLNVQLSYMPLYTSNRLALSRSLNNYLDKYRQDLIDNVPDEYKHDSAGIGTNTTRGLKSKIANPLKDNGLQFVELGNLTWALHGCWLYYKMSLDEAVLKELIYPLLKKSINYYLHFVYKGEDNYYHLPKTSSPEYGETCVDCNYDLSLLKWGCKALLEIVDILEIEDDKKQVWSDICNNLTDFPVNENGYMIGKGLPYEKSHRHFSHLMMHIPLYLVNRDNSDTKELAEKSVEWWHSKKGDIEGFSNVGAALIYSAYKDGDKSLHYINKLWNGYITKNTMYKEAGPVLETPLATAECIQQLLLQSFDGKVRVFPAVPAKWQEASFCNFSAQGGFVVSAVYENGKTKEIEIYSKSSAECVVETDIKDGIAAYEDRQEEVFSADSCIMVYIEKGKKVVITNKE